VKVLSTDIPGVLLIEPQVWEDGRGFFLETFQRRRYQEAGIEHDFVQDNLSRSGHGTLRGLHYQIERPQGKLCWVVRGEVFDVAVDLRRRSPTFGRWTSVRLSAENHRQVYIPPGLAHGFCVLSDTAYFLYKCTDFYHPEHERTILWNDPQLNIGWPVSEPIVSKKDQNGLPLAEAPHFDTE
jgi:dTDP-4-dehydrorhamnose 3,5-epimerase